MEYPAAFRSGNRRWPRGLSDKGKKQIKARIALSNYKDELEETLNEKEADKIRSFIHMKVGEVAVPDDSGK